MEKVSCQRCGRNLTNPVSVARKFGPVCWKKLKPNPSMRRLDEWF